MIEGRTTLSLIDKDGNITKKIVQKNMVTNVFNNLVNPAMDFLTSTQANIKMGDFFKVKLPIYKHYCAGLLLLQDKILENKDNIFINKNCNIVGGAGKLTDTTGIIEKGILNTSESGPLTEKDPDSGNIGYRFVWDFATDKLSTSESSAIINAVALTSSVFGSAGVGGNNGNIYTIQRVDGYTDEFGKTPDSAAGTINSTDTILSYTSPTNTYCFSLGCFDGVHMLILDTGALSSGNTVSTKIKFIKIIPFPYNNIKLTTQPDGSIIKEEKSIDISQYGVSIKSGSYANNFQYTIDGDNKKIYLFFNYNETGSSKLSTWKIIKMDLLTFEVDWVTSSSVAITSDNDTIGYYNNTILHKPYASGVFSYYEIDEKTGIQNSSNQGEYLEHSGFQSKNGYDSKFLIENETLHFNVIKNIFLLLKNPNAINDSSIPKMDFYFIGANGNTSTSSGSNLSGAPLYSNFPPYRLFGNYAAATYAKVWEGIDLAYLATINNLEETIEKTSTLALKVQYDLIEI